MKLSVTWAKRKDIYSIWEIPENDDKNMYADEVESENDVESKQKVERRFQ